MNYPGNRGAMLYNNDKRKHITIGDVISNKAGDFPANIEHGQRVIVQITPRTMQSVILYTSKSGGQNRCYLPFEFDKKYFEGLFEL